MNTTELKEQLIELGVATEDEICLVCNINGFNERALNDILYSRTGYHTLDQYMEELYIV